MGVVDSACPHSPPWTYRRSCFLFCLFYRQRIRVTAKAKVTNMNRISTARKWNRPADVTDLEYRSNEKSSRIRCPNDNWKRKNMTRRTRRRDSIANLNLSLHYEFHRLSDSPVVNDGNWAWSTSFVFLFFLPPTNSRRKEKGKQKWNTRGVSLLLV